MRAVRGGVAQVVFSPCEVYEEAVVSRVFGGPLYGGVSHDEAAQVGRALGWALGWFVLFAVESREWLDHSPHREPLAPQGALAQLVGAGVLWQGFEHPDARWA